MKTYFNSKHILLIELQSYWREFSTRVLKAAGFSVCTLDTYDYLLSQNYFEGENPDLVVLGCTCIETKEQRLIAQVLARKHHLLVFCACPSLQVVRSLFLQGAADIVNKPYDPGFLIHIVNQILGSTAPRNSYHAVERERVV